jgi:hypothetical protein
MPARKSILLVAAACSLLWVAPAHAGTITGPITAPSPVKRDIPRAIVRIAEGEYHRGVREVPLGSDYSRRIARYRAALIPRARSGAWCAYFASWVARKAGAPIGPGGVGMASSAGIRLWAIRTGRWRRYPRPGDVAVFVGHTGIVESVAGRSMTTIDGNWSNRVSRVARTRGQALGFARVAVGDHPTRRRARR